MPSASNEPMTTEARNRAIFGSSGTGFKIEAILEQDRIVPAQALQFGAQQAKGGDGRQRHAVLDRHQLRVAIDGEILRRINLVDIEVFVNGLGPDVVARDGFLGRPFPRWRGSRRRAPFVRRRICRIVERDLGRWTALEGERIKGPVLVRMRSAGMTEAAARRAVNERGNLREQIGANGDLIGRIFRERNADGVAQPVAQATSRCRWRF